MTPYERAQRAMNMQEVDYPPVWAPVICGTHSVETILGRSDIWDDPAQAYLEAFRVLKVDFINQFIAYSPGSFDARGGLVDHRLTFTEPEDVAEKMRARVPEIQRRARELNEQEISEKFAAMALKGQAFCGDDMLWIQYDGAFSMPGMSYGEFGYESYFVFLATYPDVQEEVWEAQAELASRYNRAVAAAMEQHDLPKVVRLDHDMTDNRGSIARIEMMEKHYFPHFTSSMKPFVDAGVRLVWHSDGNINQFVPFLQAAGVNGFQGFQEECGVDYNIMCNLRDCNGDPLMIWGSVSVTRVLPYLTPDEVRSDVRRCWQAAPKRGYCVGASSSICPEVPAENIIAMFDEHTKCLY